MLPENVRMIAPRRFVTRACPVCDWRGAAVESSHKPGAADCPWCHAPTETVREEWLFDAEDLRAQAAAYGRIGGLVGGKARAEKLSPKRRAEIARKAALTRWRGR